MAVQFKIKTSTVGNSFFDGEIFSTNFDFPFVEVRRVREVRFRARLPTGWNYNDHNYNEIDYEMSKTKGRRTSMDILEIDDDTTHKSTSRARRGMSVGDIQDLTDEEEDEDSSEDSEDELESPSSTTRIQSAPPPQVLVGPQYRMTFMDQERLRLKKKAQKKETKKKEKEVRRLNTVWNIDNEICTEKDLDFKVHHGLLWICGRGVAANYTRPSTSLLCMKLLR
ncbi:hypothetical protein ScPMuIL_016152 [Solemya velum]